MAKKEKEIKNRYDVIINSNIETLKKEIDKKIDEGWKPQGGIQIMSSLYMQAIILD